MKLSIAVLLFIPTAMGFHIGQSRSPMSASVGPLNSAQFSEPNFSTMDFANGGAPAIIPDIAPADLVYQETAPVEPTPKDDLKVLGRVSGSEQTSITGQLLGMDKGYKPNKEITMVTPKTTSSGGTINVPRIKCLTSWGD